MIRKGGMTSTQIPQTKRDEPIATKKSACSLKTKNWRFNKTENATKRRYIQKVSQTKLYTMEDYKTYYKKVETKMRPKVRRGRAGKRKSTR